MQQSIKSQLKKELSVILEQEAGEIISRTQGGSDADGKKFAGYSPKYKAYKEKTGRSGNVDLTFSGLMLQSIRTRVKEIGSELEGKIFFASPVAAARARGNMELRKFFELSKEQIQRIVNHLKRIR
jgi:hypothetical protein